MADSTTKLTPESVIQTYQRAKERRRMWESHWNEQPCRDRIARHAVAQAQGTGGRVDPRLPRLRPIRSPARARGDWLL